MQTKYEFRVRCLGLAPQHRRFHRHLSTRPAKFCRSSGSRVTKLPRCCVSAWPNEIHQPIGSSSMENLNQSILNLEGKVAVVTGAGQGVGEAISHLFAAHGAK